MALQSFSHIGICVSDLEASQRFYENVLGFTQLFTADFGAELEKTMEVPGGEFTSCMLARPDLLIELLGWRTPDVTGERTRRPMNQVGLTHLCFRVEKADDLKELCEQYGGTFHSQTLSSLPGFGEGGAAIESLHMTDPDGTRIECIVGQPNLADVAKTMLA